jgi:hypothetical protein
VAEPVPPELKANAAALEKTIEVSASDADVMIETNPSTTQSELAGRARAVGTQEPTDPGVLARRRQLRRRIAIAAAGGLGLVAAAIVARGVVHRASASRSAPAEVPAASSPSPAASGTAVASSSPEPAAAASSAAEPVVATADAATPPPDGQAPAASASAKTPAPKTHPARPKHAPAKVVR